MAASKSGNTPSEALSTNNANKHHSDNSLLKYQGQKWQQFFDFDKMLKQIRVAEKQHHRNSSSSKSESHSHNNSKSSSGAHASASSSSSTASTTSSSFSKTNTSSSSKGGRSLRQVQRLCGNDMHYYGIIPKQRASGIIVCGLCRGSYTKVGFNNHMMMQHPAAWGAASSKLINIANSATTTSSSSTNDIYSIISNDHSQDCTATSSTIAAVSANEILGSPSDLSGIMSTSSNASSASSSALSTTTATTSSSSSSSHGAATTSRHKSSKSSSGAGGGSSGRSRSKQSRHSSSNSHSSKEHSSTVGIHSTSTASAENSPMPSKSSKKSSSANSSNKHDNSSNSKVDNKNDIAPALAVQTVGAASTLSTTATSAVVNSGKNSKDVTTAAGISDAVAATANTPIPLYSSSSNSSCSLAPTPKLTNTLTEVKSSPFAVQDLVDTSISSSSAEYERKITPKSTHTAPTATATAKAYGAKAAYASPILPIGQEVGKTTTINEMTNLEAQLSELDQAVSSITDCVGMDDGGVGSGSGSGKKRMTGGNNKNIIDSVEATSTTPTINIASTAGNIFQMPAANTLADNNNSNNSEQLHVSNNGNNMNVAQTAFPANYVVPQEVVQACENTLPHNTSDDNSMLTFDDVFDSKFINEILSTADTEIQFDENELDPGAVVQQQQQQQQQQIYQQPQQQVQPTAKRMRFDETMLAADAQQQQQQHLQQLQQVQQQQLQLQQNSMQGVGLTGDFMTYQQQQQQRQQQHQTQYMPYNITTLDDLKMFGGAGSMLDPQQQQQQHLQNMNDQQQTQQQLTAIDAMQLQQLLYQQQQQQQQQQQTLNTHFNAGGMIADPNDPNALTLHQQHHQQFEQSGIVSAKQLIDMCAATVDIKTNKLLSEFGTTLTAADATNGGYEHMAANFQLYNIPSLTDDNVECGGGAAVVGDTTSTAEQLTGGDGAANTSILMPTLMSGMLQRANQQQQQQQYMLPGTGSNDEQLIYEITDQNQMAAVLGQHRQQQQQQQLLNEFLTQAGYEQQLTGDMNSNAAAAALNATTLSMLQHNMNNNSNNNNDSNYVPRESADDTDSDLLEFDYSLMDTVKGISSGSGSSSTKTIKSELNTPSSSSGSKSYDDIYLNTFLYAGIPKPLAINSFGLIKLPFAAATTFRKHILNTRKANNSPISLSGGGGINGIVCTSSAAAARLASGSSNTSKAMQNYFSNLTSNSNEFSIGSITITNSSQSQLYAAQQKQQQSNGGSVGGSGSGSEITFNTSANGCGSAMSPTLQQRSRTKASNSLASGGSGGSGGVSTTGSATLMRSKSQTGAPIAVVTPNNRLPPPPPRPSTAGPILAQSNKTIYVNSSAGVGTSINDRVKFIKRSLPLVINNGGNSNISRCDGSSSSSKRPKFSPRQIADFLGGVQNSSNSSSCSSGNNSNKSGGGANHKSTPNSEATTNINGGYSNQEINTNNNNNNINGSRSASPVPTNAEDALKAERVARFYERRRKLFEMARNTRQPQQNAQQQQQQQQQRTQQPQMQQKLLKQQQQLFKMLTDYGQLNAATTTSAPTMGVGHCKSANVNANNANSNGSEILRISV